MRYIGFIIVFAYCMSIFVGCQAVKYIGATPQEDTNKIVDDVQKFTIESMQNQAQISMVTYDLAHENFVEAKAAGDDAKVERSIKIRETAKVNTKTADKLSEVKITTSTPADTDGVMGAIGAFMSGNWMEGIAGLIALLAGGKAYQASQKLSRVKNKAKKFASSPETFKIDDDEDLK